MRALSEHARDSTAGVGPVPEGQRRSRTDLDAGRLFSPADAMQAERALVDVALGMHVTRAVSAGGDARLAAGAAITIDGDDAALGDEARTGGAHRDARGVR